MSSSDVGASSQPTVPFFKKGKLRPTTSRKRSPLASTEDTVEPTTKSQVVLSSRKNTGKIISAGTKRSASKRDGEDSDEEKEGPGMKWTVEGSHVNAAREIIQGDEAEEMLAKRMKKEHPEDEDDAPDDGLYRGQKGYQTHLKKRQEVPKAMRVGPQRNTSTIRTVTIVDYQPDVCKDYKETGYCGFGDTCKFLHDRGTYLAGWQLDKLAENPKKQVEDASGSDSDEDVPFACLICRKHYTDPIVTRCGHYFCSSCAIKRFGKTPKCAACGAPTGGIFNRADKIIEKINKKKGKAGDGDDDGSFGAEAGNVEIEGLERAEQSNEDS